MTRHFWGIAALAACVGLLSVPTARSFADDSAKTTAEKSAADAGWVPLFDGKTLAGWTGSTEGYKVEDGAIVCIPEKGGNLYTDKDYADFDLKFEFMLTPGANNGLGLRAPTSGDSAYQGMELQVLDDGADVYKNLKPYQYHGSVYGVVAAKRGHLKPTGEWNTQEVSLHGRHIKVTLNGTVIVDADLDEASKNGTIDGNKHPGLARTTGRIGFLGHGHKVAFRNILIKDASAK
ncbi:MAG TPA: DUF1080 domain-containing protein [Pirellulales bacterium]